MFSSLYHIYIIETFHDIYIYICIYICILDFHFLQKKTGDFEILGILRHDNDDYENECRYHSNFDKEIVLTTHLIPPTDFVSYFTLSRSPASSKDDVQDPLSGENRGVRNTLRLQVLSWNPCLPRGDDHSAVANHICEPWQSSVFKKVSILPTTRLSITGSTWSPLITAQSCSTRTRLSVTSRRIRSWYLQKKVPKGLLRA